jgi:monoamine oxidase
MTVLIDRRSALAGAAAALMFSRTAAAQSGDVDVIIIGAGAAGIAAGRRLVAAGRRVAVLEASNRIGGRCFTDTATFGVPYDRGAQWLQTPDINPVARLAKGAGMEVYPAPGKRLQVGRRSAREGELEDFLAATIRSTRAIGDAVRGPRDMPCSQALPVKELGDLRPTIEFALGPFSCARDLNELSAQDFSKALDREVDAYCRQGIGALIASLGAALPVRLETAVRKVNSWGSGVSVETSKGWVNGRALIVTVSTAVLAANKIAFDPVLPKRTSEAFAKLPLGSYDLIALEIPGNALGLEKDDLVFERATSARTAALRANINGTALCTVGVGGRFGRSLAAQGEGAMIAFAQDWITDLFGSDARKQIKRTHATNWAKEPWVMGAFASASPGNQPQRRVLMEPVRGRIYFAGEAVHETNWGTVAGAWESGERAAEAVLKSAGGGRSAPRPRPSQSAPSAARPQYRVPLAGGREDRID